MTNGKIKEATGRKAKLKIMKGGKNKDTKKRASKFDEAAFYKKYPWVVNGSIREANVGSIVGGVKVAHGRICKIKCLETGKLRTVNMQDAWQCKYSKEVQKRRALERAANRRKTNKKTKRNGRKSKAS